MLPRSLKNFAVFLDGRSYIGTAEEVQLPVLSIKTEEFRAGGMDAPIELDMGMEKLEAIITLGEYNENSAALLGLFQPNVQLVLRGAFQRQGEPANAVAIKLVGGVKSQDKGSFVSGDKFQTKLTFAVNSYTEEFDGQEKVHVDIVNMVRRIGGVDQLAEIRAAIGA